MSGFVVLIRIWLVRLGFALGRVAPRTQVLLATSHADRIGGNLGYIRRQLAQVHPNVRVTVHAHRATSGWKGRVSGAAAAIRAGFALARARVTVVDDYFFPLYVIPARRGTTVIQTWHASGAFKKIGLSVGDRSFGADEALTSRVRIHARYDLCLVGSKSAVPHYSEAFGLPADRFVTHIGIPRTDLFFDETVRQRATDAVRDSYRLPPEKRVILYAPTFRGDRVTDARDARILDLSILARRLAASHVLLLRLHPFVRQRLQVEASLADFVIDVSDHSDINELMLITDVLVTDYSSAIFEFSLLERPMVFFAPDLENYERERGFYFDYRSGVPGPVFQQTDALARWIGDPQVDVPRIREFRDASFEVADGHSSRRFVEQIILPALGTTTG